MIEGASELVQTTKKHAANEWLNQGVPAWEAAGAKIRYLTKGELAIPVIEAGSTGKHRLTVLAVAGIHMEETSGMKYLLMPENFTHLREQGIGFLIIPVVGQNGLSYEESSTETFLRKDENGEEYQALALRYDKNGKNYNDGWGKCDPKYKPEESYLIEDEIRRYRVENVIDLCISYHEDSEHPGRGYACTEGISAEQRMSLINEVKKKTDPVLLANFTAETNPYDGSVEGGLLIVDSTDPRAFECWIFDDLGIPSLLIEGPYGLDLSSRVNFQKQFTEAVLESI